MPAVSKAQKTTACMALAMKRGDLKMTPDTPAGKMAMSMSEEEMMKMCGAEMHEEKK